MPYGKKPLVSLLLVVFMGVSFFGDAPFAFATTCGTGSSITFTDIGGGQCRGYLTSGTSFTLPTDWVSSNNTVEGIGGGGAGAESNAGGGGGGEYRKISNFSASGGSSVSYVIGQGGVGQVPPTCGAANAGTNTTFNTNSLIAVGGGGGNCTTDAGGAGGTGGTGAAANANGGVGGTWASGGGGAGGGGAGGPNGVGGAGGAQAGAGGGSGGGGNGGGTAGTAGASGNNGTNGGDNSSSSGHGIGGVSGGANPVAASNGGGGGGGAAQTGANGQAGGVGSIGIEWDSTHGSGGGGGAGGDALTTGTGGAGGNGGLYGGGGGSGGSIGDITNGSGGSGANGIIVVTYTPSNSAPTVTTQAASPVSITSATLNGTITDIGSASPTVRGFAWGTVSTLSGGDTATTTENGTFGTGAFTSVQSSLSALTTYYFRAYATNTAGMGYGSIQNFTTNAARIIRLRGKVRLLGRVRLL